MIQLEILKPNQDVINFFWDLPSNWDWIPLNEIAPRDSKIVQLTSAPNQVFPYLGLEDVYQGQWTEPKYQQVLGQDIKSSCVEFDTSHILYAKLRPYLNKVVVPHQNGFGSTEWVSIKPVPKRLSREYLAWFLRSPAFVSYASRNVAGARMPRIRIDMLLKAPVPIPFPNEPTRSLDTQRRIVARVEDLLDEVRACRSLVDKTRQEAERFLTVGLDEVFTKLESVIKILPLSDIATAFNGRASGEGDSNVRVFKTKHVYPHYLRLNNSSYMKAEQAQKMPKDRYIQSDDVLMANIAEGTLGRVSYVKECEDFWTVDTQIMILRTKEEKTLLGKWLYYYLWSKQGQREILSRRTGIAFADKRGQTHIYPKKVAEIPVPLPPINEQRQAVAYLDHIQNEADEIINKSEQDAKLLDYLEQSILERAFRGEL